MWGLDKRQSPHPVLRKAGGQGWGIRFTFGLLRGRSWCLRRGGFRSDFRSRWVELHRLENLLEAAEDTVAIDVLHESFFGGVGGDVQRELVAGSILINVEVLGVTLPCAFAGDGFGGAEFHVSEQELGVRVHVRRWLRVGLNFRLTNFRRGPDDRIAGWERLH